jgi:demethylmenaquinone methyltransferase/2-methoxy-6-polyprenyl-1,4-benzoquinol methylase
VSEASDPIFAKIAARYDLINRLLSLGQERRWRAKGIEMLSQGSVLDIGCGTGDTDFGSRDVVGIDPVIEMLALSPVSAKAVGIGEELPLKSESFDGVFSAYVFRNLSSIEQTLDEVERVLKPGKSVVIIDLARPRARSMRFIHRIGTAIVLPVVGLIFAGAPKEYWYLHKSLDSLPAPEVLFTGRTLRLETVWRMGLFGFVYGARLRKN